MCTLKNRRPDAKGKKEMSFEAVGTLLDELRAMGTPGISYAGGEPLVREDIIDILRLTKRKGFLVSLTTNGLLLDDRKAEDILSTGLDMVWLSLDKVSEPDYDAFRGTRAGCGKAVAALRFLVEAKRRRKARTRIGISHVVEARGTGQTRAIIDLADEMGADTIALAPLHRFDDGKVSCAAPGFDAGAFRQLISDVRRRCRIGLDSTKGYLSLFERAFAGVPPPCDCLTGYTMLLIGPYGEVFPCAPYAMLDKSYGVYEPRRLAGLWGSPEFGRYRKELMACRMCYWNCHTEYNLMFR